MSGAVTVRLISHGSGSKNPSTIPGGRSYGTGAAGTIVDVPVSAAADIQTLTANGWSKVGASGTTAQRPTNLNAGDWYVDTTLAKAIVYDGVGYRDPVTGNSV